MDRESQLSPVIMSYTKATWREDMQSEGLPKGRYSWARPPRKSWEISQADKGAEGRAGVRHREQSLKASKGLRRCLEANTEWETQKDSHYVGIMTVTHKNHPKKKVMGHPKKQVRQEWVSVCWLGCWSSWLRELQGQNSVCDNLEVN